MAYPIVGLDFLAVTGSQYTLPQGGCCVTMDAPYMPLLRTLSLHPLLLHPLHRHLSPANCACERDSTHGSKNNGRIPWRVLRGF